MPKADSSGMVKGGSDLPGKSIPPAIKKKKVCCISLKNHTSKCIFNCEEQGKNANKIRSVKDQIRGLERLLLKKDLAPG
jgi:hypothetical protein